MTHKQRLAFTTLFVFMSAQLSPLVWADPCGMVPPMWLGDGPPITRIGAQQTYVFYKEGIETFVIKPGFSGKVDEFGMLIPFPTPPAIRKVPDDIFAHLAAAIDPPEVIVDLRPRPKFECFSMEKDSRSAAPLMAQRDGAVTVIREEAVGMYEVAVLDAGSAAALKSWMDENGYRYPSGMDGVCEEYVEQGWCFVAVKTKVGQKNGVDPRPGMRSADSKLAPGSTFDGAVQAMGFRFETDEFVLPMRLSTFNEGDLSNVVYVLSDQPQRIRGISDDRVRRQISGDELFRNVTRSLPLRVIGGTPSDIPTSRLATLPDERNPQPHNGYAKDLFASDLAAVRNKQLSNGFEETEKELLRISERLGLRGADVDALHHGALSTSREEAISVSLNDLRDMTLTVIDGAFPREVLANDNLHFESFAMPSENNTPDTYDAKMRGPAFKRGGLVFWGDDGVGPHSNNALLTLIAAIAGAALVVSFLRRRRTIRLGSAAGRGVGLVIVMATIIVASLATTAQPVSARDDDDPVLRMEARFVAALVDSLGIAGSATNALDRLKSLSPEVTVPALLGEALYGKRLASRGWAIVGLAEIGGSAANEGLTEILIDSQASALLRTWAAAGRVSTATTFDELGAVFGLAQQYPAIRRPLKLQLTRIVPTTLDGAIELIQLCRRDPSGLGASADLILSLGSATLTDVMRTAADSEVRRIAAASLANIAMAGRTDEVAEAALTAYRFDTELKIEPWTGGALFVPGIQWSGESAKSLVRNLVAWHVWADRHDRADLKQQVHNNLNSLQLGHAAGYRIPRRTLDTVGWLEILAQACGRETVREVLAEQGVDGLPKYATTVAAYR